MINEIWKEFDPGHSLRLRYAISNHGRLKSFTDDINNGNLLKGNIVNGYKVFRFRYNDGDRVRQKDLYIHRLVAENFLSHEKEDHHTHVIFLNHNKKVTHANNLKWVTYAERMLHNAQSPASKNGREVTREKNKRRDGHRLRENDVIMIKRKLLNKKTRVKILAKLYNVTETTIYRIAKGENWGHVKAFER
jgi:hypothetical protein